MVDVNLCIEIFKTIVTETMPFVFVWNICAIGIRSIMRAVTTGELEIR